MKRSKGSISHHEPKALSTRALARAVGVSESSIKRWVDDGSIRSTRTVGGHRRIPRSDALRFVRDTRATVLHPEVLGLGALVDLTPATIESAGDALTEFLVQGARPQAQGLLEALYLAGESLAGIIDGPLRVALDHIGMLWHHDPAGIFLEHRALQICVAALSRLGGLLSTAVRTPVAVGGAAAGDLYLLPSMAAALVLTGEGFDAVNLGADVPVGSLIAAMQRLDSRIVWVSVSGVIDPRKTRQDLEQLVETATSLNGHVVVGGRGVAKVRLPSAPNLHAGQSMRELAAFARGLRAGTPLAEGSGAKQ